MNVTSDMYTKLFNELTDIMNELENIKERIKKVQAETEEIYINSDGNPQKYGFPVCVDILFYFSSL